jgi:CheY-like chemotaxis protein
MVILIVDDDRDDLDLYVDLLNALDLGVHTAFTDAREALRHLQNSDQLPDVILLDFNMPYMNGLEFLMALRGEPRLRHIRVEVITTSCNKRDEAALIELGSTCHKKPSTFSDFQVLIQTILANR